MTATASAREPSTAYQFTIGGAQIHLQQVRLRDDILIDEIHLDGTELQYDSYSAKIQSAKTHAEADYKISVAETKFTAMMTESNLNALLMANVPVDAPVRNVKLILLSGKARITGNFVKSVLSLPFTLEGVPVLDNGVRVLLDFSAAKLGITLPGPIVEVIQQQLNRSLALDLAKLPFPVSLNEIKCEPGRLSIQGTARIVWPPITVAPPAAPFTALHKSLSDAPPSLASAPSTPPSPAFD